MIFSVEIIIVFCYVTMYMRRKELQKKKNHIALSYTLIALGNLQLW